jgi:hypothetical protein
MYEPMLSVYLLYTAIQHDNSSVCLPNMDDVFNLKEYLSTVSSVCRLYIIKDVGSTDGRTYSKMRDFPDPCMNQCYQCIFYRGCCKILCQFPPTVLPFPPMYRAHKTDSVKGTITIVPPLSSMPAPLVACLLQYQSSNSFPLLPNLGTTIAQERALRFLQH